MDNITPATRLAACFGITAVAGAELWRRYARVVVVHRLARPLLAPLVAGVVALPQTDLPWWQLFPMGLCIGGALAAVEARYGDAISVRRLPPKIGLPFAGVAIAAATAVVWRDLPTIEQPFKGTWTVAIERTVPPQ